MGKADLCGDANEIVDDVTIPYRRGHCSSKWDRPTSIWGDEIICTTLAEPEVIGPQAIQKVLIDKIRCGCFGYTDVDPAFADIVRQWMKRRHGWVLNPQSVLFTPRLIQAVTVLSREVLSSSSLFAELDPAYGPIGNALIANGHRRITATLAMEDGRAVLDLNALDKVFSQSPELFILCSPHNPTGRLWTREELRQIIVRCVEYNVMILSDEVHSDLCPTHRHLPTQMVAEELYAAGEISAIPTILTGVSPAKGFGMAGMESAALIVNDENIANAVSGGMAKAGMLNATYLAIPAFIAAWTQCEPWLDSLNEMVEKNRSIATEILSQVDGVQICQADGTYLLWVEIVDDRLCPEGIVDFLAREAGVLVSAGTEYGESYHRWFRMSIAMPPEQMRTICTRIVDALAIR